MTTNTNIKKYAEALAAMLGEIEDVKVEIAGHVKAAEAEGISPKLLRRIAREMIMDREKLTKRLEDEQQLDLFRSAVGLLERKGMEMAA